MLSKLRGAGFSCCRVLCVMPMVGTGAGAGVESVSVASDGLRCSFPGQGCGMIQRAGESARRREGRSSQTGEVARKRTTLRMEEREWEWERETETSACESESQQAQAQEQELARMGWAPPQLEGKGRDRLVSACPQTTQRPTHSGVRHSVLLERRERRANADAEASRLAVYVYGPRRDDASAERWLRVVLGLRACGEALQTLCTAFQYPC